MILNAYAVLDGFLSTLRLGLALGVLWLAVSLAFKWRESRGISFGKWNEYWYLLTALSTVLCGLSVVAWPMLYAVLQSYVPQWPGVMCIYGVLHVGANSHGASGLLPELLTALQVTKPLLVVFGGTSLVLYRLNRSTRTASLAPWVLGSLVVLAMLAVTDSSLEIAYLAIPKKESSLNVGCCTMGVDEVARIGGSSFRFLSGTNENVLAWSYYATNGFMVAGLIVPQLARWKQIRTIYLFGLLVGALLTIPVTWKFVVDWIAPTLLRLPHHHCPFDLYSIFPETIVGTIGFALGSFSLLWACVAQWCGSYVAPRVRTQMVARLLFMALSGYFASLTLFCVELVLA